MRTVRAGAVSATSTPVEAQGASGPTEVVFSMPATSAVATGVSGSYDVPAAKSFTEVRLTLAVAGSTTTTVEIHKDGVATGETASIGSGVLEASVEVDADFAAHENISIAVTGAGTGAKGLHVMVR